MGPKLKPAERRAARRRAKLERQQQLKRDYLARELKFGQLTLEKHEEEWRQMLMDICLPNMRNELQFAWHNFEKAVDYKDFTISLLMDELRDAENQYIINFNNNAENIDKLIRMFRDRVQETMDNINREVNALENEARQNEEMINRQATDEENYLKTMLYGLEKSRQVQSETTKIEYFLRTDDQENKNRHMLDKLRMILEEKHEEIARVTQEFLDMYEKKTSQRRQMHNELKAQDDLIQELLNSQLERLNYSTNFIKKLRAKFTQIQAHWEEIIEEIQDKTNFFHEAFRILKNKLEQDRKLDIQQLTKMNIKFNHVMDYLESLKEKGERILQLTVVCRKLETFQEKIAPFPLLSPIKENHMAEQTEDETIPGFLPQLTLFWQRYGQVSASVRELTEEKTFLLEDIKKLKGGVRKYCTCSDCPQYKFRNRVVNKKPAFITNDSDEVRKYKNNDLNPFSVNSDKDLE